MENNHARYGDEPRQPDSRTAVKCGIFQRLNREWDHLDSGYPRAGHRSVRPTRGRLKMEDKKTTRLNRATRRKS